MSPRLSPSRTHAIPVAFVLGGLGVGGNESHVVSLLSTIDRDRFDPYLIVLSRDSGPTAVALAAIEIPIVHCPPYSSRVWGFVIRLQKTMREHRTKAVLCFTFSKSHLFIHAAALLAGVRARVTVVSGSPDSSATKLKMRMLQLGSNVLCTHEVAVSNSVGTSLRHLGVYPNSRISVIPNGCDVNYFRDRARAARDPFASRYHRVAMVARLEAAKDHDTVLRAMEIVRSQRPDAELWLVGDGPRRTELEHLAATHNSGAKFLGTRQDVPEVLANCDVFVLASHTEGFGLALIEAMAVGIPGNCI